MKQLFLRMTAVMAAVLLSCTNLWAESNGKCGDNITWTLDDNGVLTISGTGKMYDYSESPWKDLSIKRGVIKEGVTNIGASAFDCCRSLASVEIPSSVTSIEKYAFLYCSSLTSVEIPNSVTSIGDGAFSGSSSMTSVKLSNSLTNIGSYAFLGCYELTSVEIPGSVTSIGDGAFTSSGLTSVTFNAEKCTKMGEAYYSVFNDCKSIKTLTIGERVTMIPDFAFKYCIGLDKISVLAKNPPACGSEVFDDVNKQNCKLIVPRESLEAYKAADTWKNFYNISAGIGQVMTDDVNVAVVDGEISITGVADDAAVEIYSANGATIYRGTNKTIAMPCQGIYIVRVAGKTLKIAF